MLTPAWQGHGPKVELAPWGRPGSTVAAKPPLPRLSATFSVPSPTPPSPFLSLSRSKKKVNIFRALSHYGQAARKGIFTNSGNTPEVKPTS